MTTRAWQAGDIKGLTPAIDLRNSNETFIVEGRNFAFTSQGPASVFGNRFVSTDLLESPTHCQSIRVRLRNRIRVFIFPGTGIYEWDEENLEFDLLLSTELTNLSPYRWTHGYLNEKIYFCHPVTGILVMDADGDSIEALAGPGVPIAPLAISVNMGRLVALDDTYISWSWQSDGSNFTPALGEAGQQKISDRVAGFPVMVSNYAQGIIVWTTGGMLRGEFTGDQEVYRFRNLNTEFYPVNSFCVLQLDDNMCVILDERGLFKSQGDAPSPFAPLFNEFLIEYIRKNNLTDGQNLRLEWDDLRRHLYVSVSLTPEYPQYEKAFVLYPPLDKWGQVNEPHLGIMPIALDFNERAGQYFGFVDLDGRIKYWGDFPSREVWDESVESAVLTGLDAQIRVGLIRFPEFSDASDRLTEIIGLTLGNIISGPEDQLGEDYLTIPDGTSDEDYEVETGSEDFGFGTLAYVNHQLRLIGTKDGRSAYSIETPSLASFDEAARHYSCSVAGVWHILELSAIEVGEAFHLRLFELNAIDGGRFG